ncbi:hypothetical protein FBULB1_2582 [Fusarium bulbicola]|nr:hypothetical protein FBULB1_2582 [Fusarium bulbicola]
MTIRPTDGWTSEEKPVKSQTRTRSTRDGYGTAPSSLSWGVSAEQETHTAQRSTDSTGTAQVARDLPPEAYDWPEAGFKWQWADGWR